MSLCEPCLQHLRTRYQRNPQTGKVLYLVNLPPNVLQQMSNDDLEKVKRLASDGMFFCFLCLSKCRDDNTCPRNPIFRQVYQFREMEDKRTIAAIDAEIERRRNVALVQLETLPPVPTFSPS